MRRTRSYAKFLAFALAVSLAFQSVPASAATYLPGNDTSNGAPRGTVGNNDTSSIALGDGAKTTLDADNDGDDKFAIALGENATATGMFSIAEGSNAQATAENAMAIGNGSNASMDNATAIGTGAVASGLGTVVIGDGAKANGHYSIAIGHNGGAGTLTTGRNAIAIGTSTAAAGENSVAIGFTAKARGESSLALGDYAEARGNNSVALGIGAYSTANNSVALGRNSLANEEDVVSIGNDGSNGAFPITRRLVNMAAGVADTDAVNVGQMRAEDKVLSDRIDNIADAIGKLQTENGQQNDAIGKLQTENGQQNDRLAAVESKNGEQDASIKTNADNIAKNTSDISGFRTDVNQNRADISTLRDDTNNRIDRVKDQYQAADTKHDNQIGALQATDTKHDNQIGALQATDQRFQNNFDTLESVLGSGYSNPTFNSLRVGNVSFDGTNINMGGGRITGLADGGIYRGSTDAVTGNQLWDAYQRMDDMQEGINIVGAHAAALSGLHPIDYNPFEPTTLSAAVGTYRDEYAVAVGVFHYMRENVLFNLGASLCSDGDLMGRAGISFTVGRGGDKKKALAPKDMNEVQAQLAEVQQALHELKAENAALKVRLDAKSK